MGFAGELQSYICEQLAQAGCEKAILCVSRTNERALKHYAKFGWKYWKPNPKHYKPADFYMCDYRDQNEAVTA